MASNQFILRDGTKTEGTVPTGASLRCFDGVNWVPDRYESGEVEIGSSGTFNEYDDEFGLGWGMYLDGSNNTPYVRNKTGGNLVWYTFANRKYSDNSAAEEIRNFDTSVADNDYHYFFSGNNFDATGDTIHGHIRFATTLNNYKTGNYKEIEFYGIIDIIGTDSIRWFFRRLR